MDSRPSSPLRRRLAAGAMLIAVFTTLNRVGVAADTNFTNRQGASATSESLIERAAPIRLDRATNKSAFGSHDRAAVKPERSRNASGVVPNEALHRFEFIATRGPRLRRARDVRPARLPGKASLQAGEHVATDTPNLQERQSETPSLESNAPTIRAAKPIEIKAPRETTTPARRRTQEQPLIRPAEEPTAPAKQLDSESESAAAEQIHPIRHVTPIVQLAAESSLQTLLQEPSPPETIPAPQSNETATETEGPQGAERVEDDLRPIGAVTTAISAPGGELPTDYAARRFTRAGETTHRMGTSREHAESIVMWAAPGVCHRPLYFEEVNLERHGSKIPVAQPLLSAAHFFGRVPALPYLVVSQRHHRCTYTLGHYRPGDYAPYSLYLPRLSLAGGALEAATVTGLLFAFP